MIKVIVTGVVLDQIIVSLACNDELAKSFSADHVLFPVKDKSIPRVLLSRTQPLDSDIRIILTAGKQPFTLADALRPALTEYLAGAEYLMRGTHQVLGGVFEVAGKIERKRGQIYFPD